MNNVNNGGLLERMQAEILELKAKVEALEKDKPAFSISSEGITIGKLAVRSPQEIRDEIIEKAKRDIEQLRNDYDNLYKVEIYSCYADFNVNKEKRTVVVLLRGKHSRKVRAKGIAKCAPGDCFNVHIGKAIALRRALGLEVPSEYTNTPQPTEVRIGDITGYPFDRTDNNVSEVVGIKDGEIFYKEGGFDHIKDLFEETCKFGDEYLCRIIDDSRDEVSE